MVRNNISGSDNLNPVTLRIPRRPSVALWAALGLALIVFSYAFTIGVAAISVMFPVLAVWKGIGGVTVITLLPLGFIMAGVILWSLVPRRQEFKIAGVPLELARHPKLKGLVEQIAASLQQPIPAFVYLIPDANAFVTERGGVLSFGGKRLMGLGLPLMANMSVSELRAVLAHEFGHFYSGDTRLGPRIYQTRSAMGRTLKNLASDSPVLGFLKRFGFAAIFHAAIMNGLVAYWKFFLRLTQTAARQQEYRCDELACFIAGPHAMRSGLERASKIGSIAPGFWISVVIPAITAGYRPPLADGFHRYFNTPSMSKFTSDVFAHLLKTQKTTAYDTHPPVGLRLDRITALGIPIERFAEDTTPAITLLDNLDLLEAELLKTVLTNSKTELKPMDWDSAPEILWLPTWKEVVSEHAQLLANRTFASVPELTSELAAIGAQIRDPPGTLLTRQQRTELAANVLSTAITLQLLNHGWKLHIQPGEFYLLRGDTQFIPAEMVRKLRQVKSSANEWHDWCAQNGLLSIPLLAPEPMPSE